VTAESISGVEAVVAVHVKCVTVQERISAVNVTDMLSLTEHQLHQLVTDCGSAQDDTHRLVLAVSNLRHCIGLLGAVPVCWQEKCHQATFGYYCTFSFSFVWPNFVRVQKNPGFLKKPNPVGFLGGFIGFWGFIGFFWTSGKNM